MWWSIGLLILWVRLWQRVRPGTPPVVHSPNSVLTSDLLVHYTTQHDTTWHDTTRHNTTQHDTTQHDTRQHDTTQHDTTQHDLWNMLFKDCEHNSVLLLLELILTWWMNIRSEDGVLRINSAELRLVWGEFHLERFDASADKKKLIREAASCFTCSICCARYYRSPEGTVRRKYICFCSHLWEDCFSFLPLDYFCSTDVGHKAALPAPRSDTLHRKSKCFSVWAPKLFSQFLHWASIIFRIYQLQLESSPSQW